MQMSRGSNIHYLFRDTRLYGRDAGTDFVETNLEQIVQEAVSMAECKSPSLEIPPHGFGRAAVEGMAQALRDLTILNVEVNASSLRLVWAAPNPGLV
ncbi:MAG: hypothetical protein INR70_10015 [Parafilimonas terrae]|nr:hypothetical protein [Parafilimonas terrae]